MTPEKALSLGVNPADVQVKTWHDRYARDWVAFVPDEERGERVLYSNASPYKVFRWRNDLVRLHALANDGASCTA